MTTTFLKLESFESDDLLAEGGPILSRDVENLRMRAFEEGYGAGWSDALEQMRGEDAVRRIAAEEALQAVAFSFQEACHALEDSVVDIVTQVTNTVLPDLLPEALRKILERELRAVASRNFATRLELICAPSVKDSLTELSQNVLGLNIAIREEDSFTEAQVMIRVDQHQRMIDLGAVIDALKSGLGPVANNKEISNG